MSGGRLLHRTFVVGVLVKAFDGLVELAGGVALLALHRATIGRWITLLTWQLSEDRHDQVASHLQHLAAALTHSTQLFGGIYLLSHGAVKLLLAVGLLRAKLWTFPVATGCFVLFVAYQAYRWSLAHSPGLLVLTALDLLVIVLTVLEWRRLRATRSAAAQERAM